ncbi:MAG: hypothetical protein HEP71_04845 [Roseivirga sp.]|nr:hypothetical protein [Roseivirga sp.]
MKSNTYSRLLMAPLLALLAVACSPNQFNQSTEYDDVYYTSSDRSSQNTSKKQATKPLLVAQEKQATLDNYSTETVDAQIVSKYNNGQPQQVTYYEDGPLVKSAQDLNYDDFVMDYQNEQLAYYDLPLDWDQDWNRASFNQLINQDFYFRLAWYDQYYMGRSFRMTQYMTGRSGRLSSNRFNNFGPRVGIGLGFNNFYLGFTNMAFVDLNPWGFYDPFWTPRRRFYGSFYDPFYDPFWCPPFYNTYNNWGWRGGWRNNVFVNNNIYVDRRADRFIASNTRSQRDVRRGPRVGTTRVATVRNEAINGSTPTTRSSRYADNLNTSSRNGRASISSSQGRARSTASSGTNNTSRSGLSTSSRSSNNRVRTDAYRFNNNNGRSSRSSAVRNNSSGSISRNSSSGTRASSRSSASRSSTARTSSRSSNPSFNRSSSSSRSSYGSSSSRSNSSGYSRGSSSRSSYSRGSSSRGSSSRGSYSRSSGSRSSGSMSRGSSSRSSGSASRGSSRSSGSRSSGSVSRGSSSRSSSGSSRSSSSSSRSSSSSSSRSGRGN